MEPQVNLSTSVFFWGFLFRNSEEPVPKKIPELEKQQISKVSSGGLFLLAGNKKGELFGWGCSKKGRLGLQSQEDVKIPRLLPLKIKVKNFSAGNWHSIITDFEGNLYGSGHNKYGSLGLKHFNSVSTFTKAQINGVIEELAAGDGFSMVLTNKGELLTCGHSQFHGHKSKQNLGEFKILKIQECTIKKISAGFTHALAVTQKGQVYSWGDGTFHQLGHGNKNSLKQPKLVEKLKDIEIVQVSCTRGQKNAHSMAVDKDGKVYTWGAGYKGKLGHHTEWTHADQADQPVPKMMQTIEMPIEKPAAGGIHSCLLTKEGEVLTFGCGSNGRIGHIESTDHKYLYREGIPRKIESLNEWNIIDLQSSYYHNICVGYKKAK